MSTFIGIVLAIVILLFMVLVHEFGHYVAGRALKFKIEEFSIGFGKAIFSRTNKRGEKISLRLFPLGGYCAFAGDEEVDTGKNKAAFTSQKPWKRIIVFLAGVTFNFITAIIFSLILLCTIGYDVPQFTKDNTGFWDRQGYTYEKVLTIQNPSLSQDEIEKLQAGDVIFYVNDKKVDFAYSETYADLINGELSKIKTFYKENNTVVGYENPTIKLTVRRDGEMMDVNYPIYQVTWNEKNELGQIVLDKNGAPITHTSFSIPLEGKAYVYSFGEGLARCVPFAFGLAWVVLKSLFLLITFQLPISQIGGPITTISVMASGISSNFSSILILIPLLSANLAIFNVLPLPALDGSHVVFTLIEWIRGKPINRNIENMIHTIGLMALFGFVIIIDLLHFIL